MDTNDLTALGADPPFLFASNEMSYAKCPYADEIVNHTHAVSGSIALIQMIQPVARKTVTTEAVPWAALHNLLTVLDSTVDAGFRFQIVVASTTGTCLSISCIGATETTVHSTGGDQLRLNGICLYWSYRHHTGSLTHMAVLMMHLPSLIYHAVHKRFLLVKFHYRMPKYPLTRKNSPPIFSPVKSNFSSNIKWIIVSDNLLEDVFL